MSLALLALLTAAPARAQHGPPPNWDITYSQSGNDGYERSGASGSYAWGSLSDQYLMGGSTVFAYAGDSASINGSGTITATLTWNAHGSGVAPPPKISLAVAASASFGGTATGEASDGLGDPLLGGVSQGLHIEGPFDSSSGTVTYSLPMSCSCSVNVPVGGNTAFIEVGHSMSVAIDNRSVAIASGLEPTSYKDPKTGLPAQNMRTVSGFMVADTVAPTPSLPGGTAGIVPIDYAPIYITSQWGTASHFAWQFNDNPILGDYGPLSGTFSTIISNVSSPLMIYDNPPIVPGSNEYVTLTLTDSRDGAVASNNYSVLFHGYYEQWKRLTRTPHPVSYTNPGNDSEWTRQVTVNSPGSVAQTVHLSSAYSDSITQSGTIGGQGSLTVPGIAAFQANENITNGETVTGTETTSYDWPGIPYSRITWYTADTYEERTGTTDAYLADGFQGTQAWHGVYATNPMRLSTTYTIDAVYPQP